MRELFLFLGLLIDFNLKKPLCQDILIEWKASRRDNSVKTCFLANTRDYLGVCYGVVCLVTKKHSLI